MQTEFSSENLKKVDYPEDLRAEERIILKWVSEK
jgi:hypothetical protein